MFIYTAPKPKKWLVKTIFGLVDYWVD